MEVENYNWEATICLAISITMLLIQISLIVHRKYSKTTSAHRLTFVPYILASVQMLGQIIYLIPVLYFTKYFTPNYSPNRELGHYQKAAISAWKMLFLEMTCFLCDGILFSILCVNDLVTALIYF